MENEKLMIPYIVHESGQSRLERTIKKLWITNLILIALLVITNLAWIHYENSFEDVVTTETYESDASDGGTAISNGDGEVNVYGESAENEDH